MVTDAIRFKNSADYLSEDDQYIVLELNRQRRLCVYGRLIICSKDGDSHLAKLETVLLKLREAGLEAKLTKCEFLKTKLTFFRSHYRWRGNLYYGQ